MSVEFDASELDALADELAKAGPKATRRTSQDMTKIAAKFRDEAKAAAPVETGELRDSIKVRGDKEGRTIVADSRAAFFQEFGTSNHPPQPFMWPQIPAAVKRMSDALEAAGDPFD